MDGIESTKFIRNLESGKSVKIVAISAHAFKDEMEKFLQIGFDQYIRKPYKDYEIYKCLQDMLSVKYIFKDTNSLQNDIKDNKIKLKTEDNKNINFNESIKILLAEDDIINQKMVCSMLKKLGLNKYYEHIPHIINRLNGLPPKTLTPKMEEELRTMFRKIQGPFEKHRPKDRKNFLNTNYVLHKLCQLKGWDEFLICFPLLKSKEKLAQQDIIWKKICAELEWEFVAS